MFAKVAALILAIGLCACALLAARQLRTQAAHELAESRLRGMQRDNELWRLRSQIAALVTPQRVQELASQISPFKPIAAEPAGPPGAALAGPVPEPRR